MGRGDPVGDSLVYGVFVTIGKFPEHLGVRKFRSAQRAGRRHTIIEYKGPAAVG